MRRLQALAACAAALAASMLLTAQSSAPDVRSQYPDVIRFIENRARAVSPNSGQLDALPGSSAYQGELTIRRAYPASQGPSVECGACTDPCRSFSLALTVVGGNGRYVGEVCQGAGGWRVASISPQSWVSQPTQIVQAPPPQAPQPAPTERVVVYGDIRLQAELLTNITNNLVRLHYVSSPTASVSEISAGLEEFQADQRLELQTGGRTSPEVQLLNATNEAVTHSTAVQNPQCTPPAGRPRGEFLMCGTVARGAQ